MTKFDHDIIVPNKESTLSKKEQVSDMFNSIAYRYDFLNRFLSMGLDIVWRKKALRSLRSNPPKYILDVATGTADFALMAYKMYKPDKIIAIDISEGMLNIGRKKVEKKLLSDKIQLENGDSETINFPENSFDAVTVAFGVRNFQNLEKGLSEIYRVLKPNSKLVVLEFSKPQMPIFKYFYETYMKKVAPSAGKLFSKNCEAYQYLDESIKKFPEGENFTQILKQLGYQNVQYKTLSFGICSIYCGQK